MDNITLKILIERIPVGDLSQARKDAMVRLADNILSEYSGEKDLQDRYALFLALLQKVT